METNNCKTIVITGGTGLIGKQLVACLLKKGHKVIVTTRNKKKKERLLKEREIDRLKSNLFLIEIDFLSNDYLERFSEFFDKEKIRPDVIVHNARSLDTLAIREDGTSSVENIVEEFKLGVAIPYEMTFKIINSEYGKDLRNIIFISSIYGVVAPTPNLYDDFTRQSPIQYGVTKASQIHLTKELAVRLADKKIRVNCISYGGVKGRAPQDFIKKYSALNPQSRMLELNEVANPLEFLVSDNSLGMTGHNLIYDSGWTIW